MRMLLIDDEAKANVKRLREWAEKPEHLYRPGITRQVPGDNPDFRIFLKDGFRCVYTITQMQRVTFRHLTISVSGQKYPNVMAAYTIAELFGFTGWDGHSERPPDGWQIAVNQKEHCVVLVQPLERQMEQAS